MSPSQLPTLDSQCLFAQTLLLSHNFCPKQLSGTLAQDSVTPQSCVFCAYKITAMLMTLSSFESNSREPVYPGPRLFHPLCAHPWETLSQAVAFEKPPTIVSVQTPCQVSWCFGKYNLCGAGSLTLGTSFLFSQSGALFPWLSLMSVTFIDCLSCLVSLQGQLFHSPFLTVFMAFCSTFYSFSP